MLAMRTLSTGEFLTFCLLYALSLIFSDVNTQVLHGPNLNNHARTQSVLAFRNPRGAQNAVVLIWLNYIAKWRVPQVLQSHCRWLCR